MFGERFAEMGGGLDEVVVWHSRKQMMNLVSRDIVSNVVQEPSQVSIDGTQLTADIVPIGAVIPNDIVVLMVKECGHYEPGAENENGCDVTVKKPNDR